MAMVSALTSWQMADVLVKYTTGRYTHQQLADEYGVHRTTISRILKRARSGDTGREINTQLKPCGTPAAHQRHLRKGEKPCLLCRVAHAKNNEPSTKRKNRRVSAKRRKNRYERAARAAKRQSD